MILALGIPAQAVIGGMTVLTDLNPWVVSFHLLVLAGDHRAGGPADPDRRRPAAAARPGPLTGLAWVTFAAAWAVLYVGTVVTGSGPHAGDEGAARNDLDPRTVSHLHADLVFLFVGLTIGLLFAVFATAALASARRAVVVLLVVELAQGTVGLVQYATDLPVVLVGFHLLGAALISATVTWALLAVRNPGEAAVSGQRQEQVELLEVGGDPALEVAPDLDLGVGGEAGTQPGVGGHPGQGGGQRGDVAGRYDERGLAIDHHVRDAAHVRGHQRRAERHRLEDRRRARVRPLAGQHGGERVLERRRAPASAPTSRRPPRPRAARTGPSTGWPTSTSPGRDAGSSDA